LKAVEIAGLTTSTTQTASRISVDNKKTIFLLSAANQKIIQYEVLFVCAYKTMSAGLPYHWPPKPIVLKFIYSLQ
jgi:hypothetical protein